MHWEEFVVYYFWPQGHFWYSILMAGKFIIFADGGARGNPGPAAIGFVIQDASGRTLKEQGEAIGETTNNVAEYKAVIAALKKLKALVGGKQAAKAAVEVFMDSELLAEQLNARYKIKDEKLALLFVEVWNLKQDFGEVSFRHIPRENNKAADRMVNAALNRRDSTLFTE